MGATYFSFLQNLLLRFSNLRNSGLFFENVLYEGTIVLPLPDKTFEFWFSLSFSSPYIIQNVKVKNMNCSCGSFLRSLYSSEVDKSNNPFKDQLA